MNTTAREIVSGGVGAAAFLGLLALGGVGFAISAGVGAVVYVGTRLATGESKKPQVNLPAPRSPPPSAASLFQSGRKQAQEFVECAKLITDTRVAERLQHVAHRLNQIFDVLERKNKGIEKMSSFVGVFLPRRLAIIRMYINLRTNFELNEAQEEKMRQYERDIDVHADELKEQYHRIVDDELNEFEEANRVLETIMNPDNNQEVR